MIIKDIRFLRQKSSDIATQEEADELQKSLMEEIKKHPDCAGLAAAQIGVLKNVVAIKNNKGDWVILVNPQVGEVYDHVYVEEGCLSFPNRIVKTRRFKYAVVKHGLDGTEETVFSDFEAVIAQHEIDHLNGILMFDREYKQKPVRVQKVGRNDPCLCGSGKKFKKCCGRN